MKIKWLLSLLIIGCLGGWGPFSFFHSTNHERYGTSAWFKKEISIITNQADNLDIHVLSVGLKAYMKARRYGLDQKQLLTIIDYSKPSSQKRMWVINMRSGEVLFNTWVSHGKNSGKTMATSFSNQPGSLKSSLGVFLTRGRPYVGGNGYSLRLDGLEHGINDNALKRYIVVHGAWYVDPSVARRYGQIGRSWGCPAVGENLAKPVIDTIKDSTLMVMYYPDKKWLRSSSFIAG